MRSYELITGRTFGLAFDHGDDFYAALDQFCRDNDVHQGYIPMFLASFAEADLVGTCEKLTNPAAPVWSCVHLTNAEALGCGTLAYDQATDTIMPHFHVAVGLKEHSATAHASHLLSARVQFLTEMLLVEVTAPRMSRLPDPDLTTSPSCASSRRANSCAFRPPPGQRGPEPARGHCAAAPPGDLPARLRSALGHGQLAACRATQVAAPTPVVAITCPPGSLFGRRRGAGLLRQP